MFNCSSTSLAGWLLSFLCLLSLPLWAQNFTAERLNGGEPILTAQHFRQLGAPAAEGANLNGPSVIRVPDWIPPAQRAAPTARYYMYFAHHAGDYIRLAWAHDIEGPWQLYRTGANVAPGARGVLDMGAERRIDLGNGLAIVSHIASPDVHVDHDARRIEMYFHGTTQHTGADWREQQSYVATSTTGLDFSAGIAPSPLAASYLRVFAFRDQLQGLTRKSYCRPRDSSAPWEAGNADAGIQQGLWKCLKSRFLEFPAGPRDVSVARKRKQAPRPRHLGLYLAGDTLYVFFTMAGHSPERILATNVKLTEADWYAAAPQQSPVEILRAERDWEGASLALRPSRDGIAREPENALRDPFVFSDEGRLYLFYAGGGEQAIGLARLTPLTAGG